MNNVRNTLLNKRLPAYLGFFVMVIALGITLILSRNTVIFVSKATVGSEPNNLQVSNITDTSFTVSYSTDENTVGSVAYGTDLAAGSIALDDRDQQGDKPLEHRAHFITIKNLTPATKYYYIVISGSQKADNGGKPYEITTAPQLTEKQSEKYTLSGTVALSDGSVPTEGLVYMTTNSSQQLATLLQPGGTYTMPLAQLRTNTLETFVPLTPETVAQLLITTPTAQSKVSLLLSQADQVPKIVLSQNYDFTLSTSDSASSSAQTASNSASFPIFEAETPVTSPEITSPKDTQGFKDQQPVFKGRALPNTEVAVTIMSKQEISTKIQSDSNGNWEFRPPIALDPGKHTITIKSLDAAGVLQTISKSFTVYAEGSQFIEPSVSPIEVSPTTIPPTIAPTMIPSPTASASPSPTINASPSASTATNSANRPPVPSTGNPLVITGIIATVAAIGIGALLFFFSAI